MATQPVGEPAPAAVVRGPLSMTQLAALALRHFPPDVAATAVAISWHESRGNPDAMNDKNNTPAGSRDRGLWQINDHWHPSVTDSCAFDPECSTAYAAKLYRENGWKPWATFKRGAYRPFLEQAEAAVEQAQGKAGAATARLKGDAGGWVPGLPDPGDAVEVATAGVNAAGDALGFIGKLAQALVTPAFWKRVGLGTAGVVILVGAVVWIRRDTIAVAGGAIAGGPGGAAAADGAVKAKNSAKASRKAAKTTTDAGAKVAPQAAGATSSA
jgi:hypothetical protein